MQASQIPTKFPIPFGKNAGSGYIRTIPQNSQIGVTAGAASLNDGFPPVTFTPVGAGGVPPFGQDFNGLLNQITAWNQWQNAGGMVQYDSTFSAAVGGYPAGAVVYSASVAGRVWISTADNNTTNPDSGGALNWLALMLAKDIPSIAATLTPVGASQASAFTANLVASDIALVPSYTTTQTVTVSGATWIQANGANALANDSSTLTNFTTRLRLMQGATVIGDGPYLGGVGNNSLQIPLFVQGNWSGLDPTKVYTLNLISQKTPNVGPVRVLDARILAYYGAY